MPLRTCLVYLNISSCIKIIYYAASVDESSASQYRGICCVPSFVGSKNPNYAFRKFILAIVPQCNSILASSSDRLHAVEPRRYIINQNNKQSHYYLQELFITILVFRDLLVPLTSHHHADESQCLWVIMPRDPIMSDHARVTMRVLMGLLTAELFTPLSPLRLVRCLVWHIFI